jgi:hypothetical protein
MDRLWKGVANAGFVVAPRLVGEGELSDASSTLTGQCSSTCISRKEHFECTRTIRVPAQKPFGFQHFELMRNARGRGQANGVAHLSDARRIAAPFDSVLDHFQDATLPKRQTVGIDRAVWE